MLQILLYSCTLLPSSSKLLKYNFIRNVNQLAGCYPLYNTWILDFTGSFVVTGLSIPHALQTHFSAEVNEARPISTKRDGS